MAENQAVDASGAAEGLNGAIEALEELILEDEYFTNVEEPLDAAIYLTLTDRGGDALDKFLKEKLQEIQSGRLEQTLLSALHISTIDGKVEDFIKAKDFMEDVITATNNIPELKEEEGVEAKENEAKTEFNKAKKQIEEFTGLVVDFNNYAQLKERESRYIEFAENEIEQKELKTETKEDLADSSMNIVDLIFGSIGDVLINGRDRAYINEYIMMRFNHHKFTSRGLKAGGSTESEIEYILYGQPTPQLNVGAALGELYAFRFAVNFIEAFTDDFVRKSGKFILLFATAYALIETTRDFAEIMNDRPINFIDVGKGRDFMTGYGDYLRLFLFVHPNGNKMQRTLARIDQKTGNDLTKTATYIEGEVEASVELWFLPGVADMLGKTGILDGQMNGNEFRIRKKAIYSY
ncbi:DUF5702 domain-containing protein [Alkalicoccobacillus plakortidis]|uniref:DUF5702 domain-containing protein n=1 Tax=Alkalicoccobacillus plakortidis TaxID=444060 RepID=A0ABT0XMK3_9BACI|nr:DUF5702 domain-containing protein [Alkalicoccobacillus plakortidis]MCM2677126.1 DUF5702 domain-containing protein [Alkalicoccobacillus plakortidis]